MFGSQESMIYDKKYPRHLRKAAEITMIHAGIWHPNLIAGWDEKNHIISYDNMKRGFGPRNEGVNERAGDWDKVKDVILPWLELGEDNRGCEWAKYYELFNADKLRLNDHKHVSEELFFKWMDEYDVKVRTKESSEEESLIASMLLKGMKSAHVANALMAGAHGYEMGDERCRKIYCKRYIEPKES